MLWQHMGYWDHYSFLPQHYPSTSSHKQVPKSDKRTYTHFVFRRQHSKHIVFQNFYFNQCCALAAYVLLGPFLFPAIPVTISASDKSTRGHVTITSGSSFLLIHINASLTKISTLCSANSGGITIAAREEDRTALFHGMH